MSEKKPKGAGAPRFDPRSATAGLRWLCFDCGTPWASTWLMCEACSSYQRELGLARPKRVVPGDHVRFGGPWELLPWPGQGAVALYGGPGAGKSTLAGMIHPKHWLTREQAPKAAGDMFRRVTPDYMPQIYAVDSAEQVGEVLATITSGPVVIDSLSAFGLQEALHVAHMLVAWARVWNERSLGLLQVNSAGESAGYNEIPHLFDAVIYASTDKWGVRTYNVEKSRWSPLTSKYWTFDADGKVILPVFNAAYTVEGTGGNYYLHPYPMKGAQWSDILAVLERLNLLKPGVAGAGVLAHYMPGKFLAPMDAVERARFARAQGLEYLDIATWSAQIVQTVEDQKLSWNTLI